MRPPPRAFRFIKAAMSPQNQSTRPIRHRFPRRRRGAILLAILVLVVVLSYVILQFIERGLADIAGEGYYVERNRLRLEAWSAMETTLAVLADVRAINGALHAPAQGWQDPIGYAGVEPTRGMRVTIRFTDESGRLPVNLLDYNGLYLIFQDMGFEPAVCSVLTNSLLDWIDEDDEARIDGAEVAEYSRRETPHRAANRPLRNLMELAVVNGFDTHFFDEYGNPNHYFRRFQEIVTLQPVTNLNLNAVNRSVLKSLALFDDAQIDMLLEHRSGAARLGPDGGPRYFSDLSEVTALLGPLPQGARMGVSVEILRIDVSVTEGLSTFALRAVVRAGGGGGGGGAPRATGAGQVTMGGGAGGYPFVFLEIREEAPLSQGLPSPTHGRAN